jgi:hypothetical protein
MGQWMPPDQDTHCPGRLKPALPGGRSCRHCGVIVERAARPAAEQRWADTMAVGHPPTISPAGPAKSSCDKGRGAGPPGPRGRSPRTKKQHPRAAALGCCWRVGRGVVIPGQAGVWRPLGRPRERPSGRFSVHSSVLDVEILRRVCSIRCAARGSISDWETTANTFGCPLVVRMPSTGHYINRGMGGQAPVMHHDATMVSAWPGKPVFEISAHADRQRNRRRHPLQSRHCRG